jgi:hypothetical protein
MSEASYYNNIKDFAFNSVGDDRLYDANDLCDWLKSTNSNGVRANPVDQLKVKPSTGLTVQITKGVGLINGHSMELTDAITIPVDTAPLASTGYSRKDIVGFRVNNIDRKMEIFYRPGTAAATPVVPSLIQNENYYELCLGELTITAGLTTIGINNITDTRDSDKCGFIVSSATIFTPYEQIINTTSTVTTFQIELATFNPTLDIVTIAINGNKLTDDQFTITGRTVVLKSAVYSGNTIDVDIWHFVDASGVLANNMGQVEQVSEEVNKMVKYYYFCNGINDNKLLSDLAQNFLAGTGEFVGVDTYAQMELIICGEMGTVNQWYSGNGTQATPYTYFAFGRGNTSTRTIYFNFSNCARINVSCPTNENVYATIFSGADINIRNVALNVGSGYNVDIFNGTNIHCQDSEFWMTTINNCCVGRCCGIFENVRTSIASTAGNAFGFYGNGNLTRIIGGTHYAWTAGTNKEAVCFYVEAYQTANVLFVSMANMPQYSRSGYTQSRPIKINNGYCTVMQCAMWMAATVDNGSFYDATKCTAYGNAIISKN